MVKSILLYIKDMDAASKLKVISRTKKIKDQRDLYKIKIIRVLNYS